MARRERLKETSGLECSSEAEPNQRPRTCLKDQGRCGVNHGVPCDLPKQILPEQLGIIAETDELSGRCLA